MSASLQPGKLVSLRGREWVVLPSDSPDLVVVRPLGGSEEETTGIYLPLGISEDKPQDARFDPPEAEDLGDISTARLLYDAARLAFRNGAGPFRALAKLSFRPRAYQIVPLVMALRQETVRLLVADDVGVGKTVEALLIVREMIERAQVSRFAVICLPHLCDQWQQEFRAKLGIEAVVIRSNTQARLDRMIQGDASVYDYYPYQIISIDYIKADSRRAVFVQQCPELVIVDEAHTCARPAGATRAQQQRHHLLRDLADKQEQHLIMLTATPHSGKPEEFHSLLGLLSSDFETLDLPASSQSERRALARHFIQRKRADVERWMGEDTPFPDRDTIEWNYDLSAAYLEFFNEMVDFARRLVSPSRPGESKKKAHYWTALGLLRGVMSSPAAGVKMLAIRRDKLAGAKTDQHPEDDCPDIFNPVGDPDLGLETDTTPTQVMEREDWTEHQRRQLRRFAERLQAFAGTDDDQKLYAASIVLEDWLSNGFNPVVFCRFIETANYVGEHLEPLLTAKIPRLNLQVVTSEDPDELRRQRIEDMAGERPRILIATDCLSQGINLQDLFTAVLHYDLPWNPNDLEQREGRVDRFGQQAPEVKVCLLYGVDNPIDGIVLDVLLRKVREIKRSTGINVPFPEDSQSIIDTITQSLLLNPDRRIQTHKKSRQIALFDFSDFPEAAEAKDSITRKIDEAAEREKASRSIFAQNAIKAQEIEEDLRAVDEAIGDPDAVRDFVIGALENIFGVQVTTEKNGFGIVAGNLPPQLGELLPEGQLIKISFESPTPEGYHYVGRNHRFVEQLCQLVMANTVAREGKRAARASVIRTRQVQTKTTLLLFRCRNVIEQGGGGRQIVAEEMLLWGWSGTPDDREHLDHEEARALLRAVRASSNLSTEARASFLENELGLLDQLDGDFSELAEGQSKRLVAAHERFSALVGKQRFQIVYPVLPMDLMGVYILLPEGPA
ncbi:MAG: DEAD/DEAH box helicase [Gammaproteobacteria bacterium]|nr:DEAD/DEAH box helicase [Gammaproteobacteria bacterium]MYH46837.1 DEAD/DEAH box helicase [Gammaproteobacteria bacterium]MYL13563.1 DEAD/DEAH box helicase [Gammaproteobacteria bacterium]